jgi:hypothetical protein
MRGGGEAVERHRRGDDDLQKARPFDRTRRKKGRDAVGRRAASAAQEEREKADHGQLDIAEAAHRSASRNPSNDADRGKDAHDPTGRVQPDREVFLQSRQPGTPCSRHGFGLSLRSPISYLQPVEPSDRLRVADHVG